MCFYSLHQGEGRDCYKVYLIILIIWAFIIVGIIFDVLVKTFHLPDGKYTVRYSLRILPLIG